MRVNTGHLPGNSAYRLQERYASLSENDLLSRDCKGAVGDKLLIAPTAPLQSRLSKQFGLSNRQECLRYCNSAVMVAPPIDAITDEIFTGFRESFAIHIVD